MAREDVTAWYAEKTTWLLAKYGPGPRVHFHTGLVPPDVAAETSSERIRLQIVGSQEEMLRRASTAWDAPRHLSGDVVDMGCGLGGSALYFAGQHGARVTALTPVAAHAELVTRFASESGLSERVTPTVGDAHTVPGAARFDAAYAIGASNYFDRPAWFRHLATLLRRPGHVFVEDTFLVRDELAAPFNDYWLSRIGTRAEYVAAAKEAGFQLVSCVDVTEEAAGFYRLSVAHSQALVREGGLDEAERRKRERSIAWQTRFKDAYLERGFEDLMLHFAR